MKHYCDSGTMVPERFLDGKYEDILNLEPIVMYRLYGKCKREEVQSAGTRVNVGIVAPVIMPFGGFSLEEYPRHAAGNTR